MKDWLFVDVETTGLTGEDRVVSLGLLRLDANALEGGALKTKTEYFVFNPGRPSHPRARKVHGFEDEFLARQPTFASVAQDIAAWFHGCELVAAHNASFDRRFVVGEFAAAGKPARWEMHCTMRAFKNKTGGKGGLDVACQHIGVRNRGDVHGALEDAWLAANVHFWNEGLPTHLLQSIELHGPTNLAGFGKSTVPPPIKSVVPWSGAMRQQLLEEARPMASLMAYIIFADGVIHPAELDALAEYVDYVRGQLGLPPSLEGCHQMAADILAEKPDEHVMATWVGAVMRDQGKRQEFVPWMRKAGHADGIFSLDESEVVRSFARIAESLAREVA